MSVRNAIVLFLALSTLSLLVGCGSTANRPTPPPTGGFSNTDFSGTYTFSVVGADVNGTFAMAGSLVACGCAAGTISSGNADLVDPGLLAPAAVIGNNSTYTINSDGRGFAKLFITPTGGAAVEVDIDFVLTSGSHGLIIRFDQNGTGSGTIDLQPSAASLGNVAYAFILSGSDNSSNPLATVGAFTLSSGTISPAGVQDINYLATTSAHSQLALTGSVSVGSGTAPGIATLNTSFGNLTFDVYAIDSTHLKVIESDGKAVLVGDVFTQTSASIPNENLVFTMAGLDSVGSLFAAGGLMSSDGTSMITSGAEDVNDAGIVDNNTTTPFAFNGSFAATGGGRFTVTLTNFIGGSLFAAYPSDGGLLMLEIDSGLGAGITSGVALAQTAGATITASSGYGLNLTGEDVSNGVELDEIAEFKTTSSAFTNGLLDENDGGTLDNPQNLGGTYTVSNGSGSAINVSNGLQSMFFYVADSSTVLFISTDPNQAAQGVFEIQSTPQSGAQQPAAQTRSLPMLRSIPHPHSASRPGGTGLGIGK